MGWAGRSAIDRPFEDWNRISARIAPLEARCPCRNGSCFHVAVNAVASGM